MATKTKQITKLEWLSKAIDADTTSQRWTQEIWQMKDALVASNGYYLFSVSTPDAGSDEPKSLTLDSALVGPTQSIVDSVMPDKRKTRTVTLRNPAIALKAILALAKVYNDKQPVIAFDSHGISYESTNSNYFYKFAGIPEGVIFNVNAIYLSNALSLLPDGGEFTLSYPDNKSVLLLDLGLGCTAIIMPMRNKKD